MIDIDQELRKDMLLSSQEQMILNAAQSVQNESDVPTTFSDFNHTTKTKAQKESDYLLLQVARDRSRNLTIQEKLRDGITTNYTFDADWGQAYAFDHELLNPFEFDHTFEISIHSRDLRIVLNEQELLYHRKSKDIHQRIESQMIKEKSPNEYEIFVRAKESIKIPLILQITQINSESDKVEESEKRIMVGLNLSRWKLELETNHMHSSISKLIMSNTL